MRRVLLLLFFCVSTLPLAAQSVTPTVVGSAGGSGEIGDITVMWTLGEVAVTTLRADGLYVTQGFHQPPPGTTDAPLESAGPLVLQASPNPVTTYLNVELPGGTSSGIFTLVDLLGRSVVTGESHSGQVSMTIDIAELPSGTYLARYVAGNQVYSTTVTVQR